MGAKEDLFANFEKWSEKTGWTLEQLESRAEKIRAQWPDLEEEASWKRTASALGSQMAREMKSDAKPLVMYFFNAGDPRNLSERDYEDKKNAFMEDPVKAVAEGDCDDQGTPLDTRPTYPNTDIENPQYGKPLRPFYQAVDVGLARRPEDDNPKFFTLRRRNRIAKTPPPIKSAVVARVNIRTEDEKHISATSSNLTRFESAQMPEIEGMTVADILQAGPDEYMCNPLDLLDYIDADPDADTVILEGDVISDPMETSTGNIMFSMGDIARDMDFNGVTVFAPMEGNEHVLNHGAGSRYIVIGYPREGEDREGNPQGTLNANAIGVIYTVEKMADTEAPEGDYEV